MPRVKRALISVYDKTYVDDFARGLMELGVEILSTGGTAEILQRSGIPVIEISAYTGFPEMLGGRVKSLNPKIFAGILAIRGSKIHEDELRRHNISFIDLVAVNLYPFTDAASDPTATLDDILEMIDIGGPSLLRAAAKNFKGVVVIVDPTDYQLVLHELQNKGFVSEKTSFALAAKAFNHTAWYDTHISQFFNSKIQQKEMPRVITLTLSQKASLRYGENPHQKAAIYELPMPPGVFIARAEQLHGKELSYNNYLDADAALNIVKDFQKTAVAIVKHTNPCGVAISTKGVTDAYKKALETDPQSAFGGIVAFNKKVTEEVATLMSEHFFEVVIAPDYDEGALEILKKKKNLRILKIPFEGLKYAPYDHRSVEGGLLVQERDTHLLKSSDIKVVTKRQPTKKELSALKFAWTVVKHVKSNAIVITDSTSTIGIGAGQMSRVDSVKIAISKSLRSTEGAVAASDAFFPFRDSIDVLAEAGIRAVIQPGGSVRDKEVIRAADEHNMAMVFTGIRHFKH